MRSLLRKGSQGMKTQTSSEKVAEGGYARAVKPMTPKDLEAVVQKVGAGVEEWDSARIVLEKPLQDAARNHGRVLLMKDTREGNRLMAVKQMPNRWMRLSPKDFNDQYPTASEKPWEDIAYVAYLGTVGFPYVCEFYGIFRSPKETFVASQFCSGGDLFGWCDHPSVPPVGQERESVMLPIVGQIFDGVCWLHDLGIAHRDLSLENILLQGQPTDAKVKLIDFGMTTLQRMVTNQIRGKDSYQAPEVHSDGEVDTFLGDNFALGVVMFAMAAHDYPWTCTKRGKCQLFEYVSAFGFRRFLEKRRSRKKKDEFLCTIFSSDFVDVLDALLKFDPKHRACVGEATFVQKKTDRKNVWEMTYLRLMGEQLQKKKQADRQRKSAGKEGEGKDSTMKTVVPS
eukprot:CAMPEP_0170247660 /NCGR_PEP_ID=MMETSP0116_2-20130129/23619_1 /TAXON_ID=400756 /ORGANISM="Durinskia baltica, Strain CSIRO CS-38" /LENGTH=396 /DNA_ID=CAMNT_0010498541 /DNA_START=176 /DNA_END=1366 /DNA_ORIENTATION=-